MRRKKLIQILKIILPLLVGVFLIFYSINSATPEERRTLFNNIVHANPVWIIISAICALLSHLSRAYRWKFLLKPLGYQLRFSYSFMAVMAAYLANLGIPRSGEVLRGASIATYEKIPFDKAFGTIISERVADLIMLLLILGTTVLIQAEQLLLFFKINEINPFLTLLVLFLLIALGVAFIKVIQKSTNKFLVKIRTFAVGVLEGMKSILKMKKKKAFLLHTLFIWGMYVLMFYLAKFAVPGTSDLPISTILVAFVVGSFAISITNGGIGVYPIAIGAILLLFGVQKESGEAFGWIVWGTQTLLNLIIGGLSMFFMPFLNKSS